MGCTYWLSVFRWLHNDTWGGRYSSPLDMPRYKVHQPQNLRVMKYFRYVRCTPLSTTGSGGGGDGGGSGGCGVAAFSSLARF